MQTREMWGHHAAGCASIFNARRECVVQIMGGTMGTFDPGWLESQRVQRHLYCIEWIPILPGAWRKATCISVGSSGRESTIDALSHVTVSSTRILFILRTEGMLCLPMVSAALALVQSWTVAVDKWAEVYLVTSACAVPEWHEGLQGLSRSVRQEARVPLCWVEVRWPNEGVHHAVLLAMRSDEPELIHFDKTQMVPRLMNAPKVSADVKVTDIGGAHVVTGGLGGLGLLTGRWLASQGANDIVLVSGSGRMACSGAFEWSLLEQTFANVQIQRGDVADQAGAHRLVSTAGGSGIPQMRGLWHAAGVLADAVLAKQSDDGLHRVYAPKVFGAMALQTTCVVAALSSCVLFSAVAALLGGAGQANYSAANACLDAHATARRARGVVGTSTQWGAWAEVGMAANDTVLARVHASGFGLIGQVEGLVALRRTLQPHGAAVVAVLPVRWGRMLGGMAVSPAFLSGMAPRVHFLRASAAVTSRCEVGFETVLNFVRRTAGGAVDADAPLMEAGLDSLGAIELRNQLQGAIGEECIELPSSLIFEAPTARLLASHVENLAAPVCARAPVAVAAYAVDLEAVLQLTRRTAGAAVDADAPLMEAGLDSLGAVELRNQLQGAVGDGVELPSSLIFEAPTARQLAQHLADFSSVPAPGTAAVPDGKPSDAIRVTAACALLPGAVATSDAYGCVSALGVDVTSEVPAARWDVDAVDANAMASGLGDTVRLRMRYGAFVRGAQLFDASGFAVSPAEASAMDPQQRLLLEQGYSALHMGCLFRESLLSSNTGVYLGYSSSDFAQVLATSPLGKSGYTATGTSGSIASGRLSYVLGLQGACSMIDTACSAGLVATSFARAALVLSESEVASVVAVNLILSPGGAHTPFAIVGMTSATGKCHTFDKQTDGYARSEACGAAVVQTTMSVVNELMVLEGSAVRCDGKSASLTAPNGQAQRQVICAAFAVAHVAPDTLSLMEAHGTGTALGDPMELGSVKAVVLAQRDMRAAPMAVGSVKANAGHAEPAAGLSGLLKLAIGLARGDAAPNAQLRALNTHVGDTLRGVSCALPVQLGGLAFTASGGPSRGAVSSFGYSGTIAHVVLRNVGGDGDATDVMASLVYRHRAFLWREVPMRPAISLQSCTLTGRLQPLQALKLMQQQLPDDVPTLLTLHSLTLHTHTELAGFIRGRKSPLVVLCQGYVRGAGALLVLDAATVSFAEAGCKVRVDNIDVHCTRRCSTLLDSRVKELSAPKMAQLGILDYVAHGDAARAGAERAVSRLALVDDALLKKCQALLPAQSVDAAIVAMGTLHPPAPRLQRGRLVRLYAQEEVAVVELHDPLHFNALSSEMVEDIGAAVGYIQRSDYFRGGIVLRGHGPHFCIGGNPYETKEQVPLAALASSLQMKGLLQLHDLRVPIVCALQGHVVGGGMAVSMLADYRVAHYNSTFEHGNLVRGVCPLAGFSLTLPVSIGLSRALIMYLRNKKYDAKAALHMRIVHEISNGTIEAAQHRAYQLAHAFLSTHAAELLLSTRATPSAGIVAAEAVGHARCRFDLAGGVYAKPSDAASIPTLHLQQLECHMLRNVTGDQQPRTIRTPTNLADGGLELEWSNNALLIFRGMEGAENFCLGGNPSQANLASGSFLAGVPEFGGLLQRLRDAAMPKLVICHGATRGGGMVFPCLGTAVLAHDDATFGFPEIRRGVLPGVVSVAAHHRLTRAACTWLFCTGDTVDASTAKRLGLVDFTGSWDELEQEASRLVKHFQLQAASMSNALEVPLLGDETLQYEADDTSQMVRLVVGGNAAELESSLCALSALLEELSSLRVIVLQVETQPSGEESVVCSQTFADALAIVIGKLSSCGIVVICTLQGHASGNALLLFLSAHYRVIDTDAWLSCKTEDAQLRKTILQTLHADDAQSWLREGCINAARVMELGVASERSDGPRLKERALRFAQWLACQPRTGMMQMLQLTCPLVQDPAIAVLKHEREEMLRSGLQRSHASVSSPGPASRENTESMEERALVQSRAVDARERLRAATATSASKHLKCPQQEHHAIALRHAGIHVLEVYVPRHCTSAADLERAHKVEGKYTVGLMMREWAACDEDEDVVSMALTVVRRLIERHSVRHLDIGMLQVSSESLLDRSKSIKSHLMALFEPHGCANIEGVDHYHACYGGTAALFTCTNWVESSVWDGRWAIAVATDVSDAPKQYPFMNGAAAVAMLVGADAPLALEGERVSHFVNVWDFYKPVGWHMMEPIVDGPGSMEVYFACLAACQRELQMREGGQAFVNSHDFLVFHLGSGPKFVRHAFETALVAAHGEGVLADKEVAERFERLVEPSLRLGARIGPMHSAAVYVNLTSLLLHATPAVGSRIGVFSFGSGAASSMYHLRVHGQVRMDRSVVEWLEARERLPPPDFIAVTKRFSSTYGRFDWVPRVRGVQPARSYRVTKVGVLGKREYEYVCAAAEDRGPLPCHAVPYAQPITPTPSRHAGIHVLEVYVPRHCTSAADLERAHKVEGKYTVGLMMREWAACDEDEDVVSMALTVVRRLIERHSVRHLDIGMLQVSSESLLDRSKSIKSHLMALFEPHGCANIEGVDHYHACYGGTAALFTCTNWVESSVWDGRWAIAVATDVSDAPKQYPFMNGAAAVAMLVGADAPLALEGERVSHFVNVWDFYKPVGWHMMEPIVDGPGSMEVYFACLAACQRELQMREGGQAFVNSHDFLVFHLGSGPKFVRHAFETALVAAHGEGVLADKEVAERFERLVEPSLRLGARIGPMHSAAVYVNLTSLLLHATPAVGSRIGVFSFGSGAASSMYHLRVHGQVRMDRSVVEWLEARERLPPPDFIAVTKRFSSTYGRFDWVPRVRGVQPARSYRVTKVGVLGKREYEYVALTQVLMNAPETEAVPPTIRQSPAESAAVSLALLQQLLASLGAGNTAASASSVPANGKHLEQFAVVVREVARELLPDVSADAPLLEAGLDSLGAVELRNRLAARLGDAAELPETLIFDFPTLRQIEAHLGSLMQPQKAAPPPTTVAPPAGLNAALLAQLLGGLHGTAASASPTHPLQCAIDVMAPVREVARELLPDVSADAPLLEAGLDSLGAVELRNRLAARLGDAAELPETLIFDFPTLRQIEAHLGAITRTTARFVAGPEAAASDGVHLRSLLQLLLQLLLHSLGSMGGGQDQAAALLHSALDAAVVVDEAANAPVSTSVADPIALPISGGSPGFIDGALALDAASSELSPVRRVPRSPRRPKLLWRRASQKSHRLLKTSPQKRPTSPVCEDVTLLRVRAGDSTLPTLVLVHGVSGDCTLFCSLISRIRYDPPILALVAAALVFGSSFGNTSSTPATIMSLSRARAQLLHRELGQRSFDLIGVSFGAALAQHIALEMVKIGHAPPRVVMIDPPPPPSLLNSRQNPSTPLQHAAAWLKMAGMVAEGPYDDLWSAFQMQLDEMLRVDDFEKHLSLVSPLIQNALNWIRHLEPRASADLILFTTHLIRTHARNMDAMELFMSQSSVTPLLTVNANAGIFLVLASERRSFFNGTFMPSVKADVALEPASYQEYGTIATDLELDGDHLEVCAKAGTGRSLEFLHRLEEFLVGRGSSTATSTEGMQGALQHMIMSAIQKLRVATSPHFFPNAPLLSHGSISGTPSAISMNVSSVTPAMNIRAYLASEGLSMFMYGTLCLYSNWQLRDITVASAFVDLLLTPGRSMFSFGAASGWKWFLPPAKLRITLGASHH